VREQAAQFRETLVRAVHASWTADWAKSVTFSLGVGVFLGLVGAFGSDRAPLLSRILIFALVGLGSGLIVALCIALVGRWPALASRPVSRRIVVSLAVAPLSGVWIWLVISYFFLGGLKLWALGMSLGYSLLLSGPMAALSWLVFRPRLATPTPAAPRFLERLPPRLWGAEVYAVEAEDHYLRLHTSKGSDLILMRLSDAIAELDGLAGARTHRSWWVAKAGVADIRRRDGRPVLLLKDGVEAPVSRTHASALRATGWL
jgi:hypothetical protein